MRRAALRITGIYAILGAAWILFSDRLVRLIVAQPDEVAWLQTGKGWLFVLGTALLIYLLVHRRLITIDRLRTRHEESPAERREVQRELSEKERVLATLMSNLPGMAYRCRNERDRPMEFVSEGCREFTGYAAEDLVNSARVTYGDLIHPEDREAVWAEVQAGLEAHGSFHLMYRISAAGGAEKWVWEQGSGVFADDGTLLALVGLVTDITERKRPECQLQQAARLESIGQLAGSISHDFNNVLGAILGYCEMFLCQVDSASPLRQDVIEIKKAAKRGAALAGQLLAFSRKRESLLSVLSLNDIVDELVAMLGRLVGTGVQLNTRLDPALGYVKADAPKLGQVVMNLVVNARDAMPDGGTITIETANVELDEEYAAAHPSAKPGPHVMLAVSDTGFGMDEETQSRIFEPYFTTKGPEKGTGLGLSTVYNIVKDSSGNIWVYSTPGVGTTFRVYLPQVSEAGAPLVAREAPAELPGGRETILVVDDEEALQLLMSRVLERSGYSVLVAGDGKSALELAGGYEGPIDVVITDLMLPEMTGLDLAERLVESRPEMKVLYISGHGDLDVVRPGAFKPGMAFLQKPFTPSALVGKLRHALDTSAGDVDRTLLDHPLASATG